MTTTDRKAARELIDALRNVQIHGESHALTKVWLAHDAALAALAAEPAEPTQEQAEVGGVCSVCGSGVRYGSRHVRCAQALSGFEAWFDEHRYYADCKNACFEAYAAGRASKEQS